MDTQAVIDQFNVCLKMEYTALTQYNQQSFLLRGVNRVPFLEFFQKAAEEAFSHTRMCGEKVVALGGVPTIERADVKQATDLIQMLQDDLELERAALAEYEKLLTMVQDYTALRVLIEDQILTEQGDVWEIEKVLETVQSEGLARPGRQARAS